MSDRIEAKTILIDPNTLLEVFEKHIAKNYPNVPKCWHELDRNSDNYHEFSGICLTFTHTRRILKTFLDSNPYVYEQSGEHSQEQFGLDQIVTFWIQALNEAREYRKKYNDLCKEISK